MGEYSGALIASVNYVNNATSTPAYRMMVLKSGSWSSLHTMNAPLRTILSYNNSLCVGGTFTLVDADSISYLATLLQSNHKDLLAEEGNAFSVYPNPVQDELFIHTELDGNGNPPEVNFILMDITGREVADIYNINTTDLTLSRNGLSAGMYIYRITNRNNEIIKQGKLTFK